MILKVISTKGTNASKSIAQGGDYTQDEALHDHRILATSMLAPLLAMADGRQVLTEPERLLLYDEFNTLAVRRPDVERPFIHIAVSLHNNDSAVATPSNWSIWGDRIFGGLVEAENIHRARKRAARGLTPEEPLDTNSIAWVAIGHDEKPHPHAHFLACRVTQDGRLFYGSFIGQASRQICRSIEDDFGLVPTRMHVERSPRQTIVRDVSPQAMNARLLVTQALIDAPSLSWLNNHLAENRIEIKRSKRGWRALQDGKDVGPGSRVGFVGRYRPDRLAAALAERSSPNAQLRNRLYDHRAKSSDFADFESRLASDNVHLVSDDQQRLLFAVDGQVVDPSSVGFRRGLAPERLKSEWIPPRAKASERIVPPPADPLATLLAEVEQAEKKQAEQLVQRSQRPVGEEIARALSTVGWRQAQVQGFMDQRAPGYRVDLERQVVTSQTGEQRFADIGVAVVGKPKEGAKMQAHREPGGRWVVGVAGSAAKVVPQAKAREVPKDR